MHLILFGFWFDRYLRLFFTIRALFFAIDLWIVLKVHKSFFFDGDGELIDRFLKLAQVEILDAQVAEVLHSIEKTQLLDKGCLYLTFPLS